MKTIMETIPITKFNRGQAGKIFGDVKKTNETRIVIKNNEPEVVLLSPEVYNRMAGIVEDFYEKQLYMKIAERLSKKEAKLYTEDDVLKELGISKEELSETDLSDVDI